MGANDNVFMMSGTAVAKNGVDIYLAASAGTVTGRWKAIQVLSALTITAITETGADTRVGTSTVPLSDAIPAGAYIAANGIFTSITFSSGDMSCVRVID